MIVAELRARDGARCENYPKTGNTHPEGARPHGAGVSVGEKPQSQKDDQTSREEESEVHPKLEIAEKTRMAKVHRRRY